MCTSYKHSDLRVNAFIYIALFANIFSAEGWWISANGANFGMCVAFSGNLRPIILNAIAHHCGTIWPLLWKCKCYHMWYYVFWTSDEGPFLKKKLCGRNQF